MNPKPATERAKFSPVKPGERPPLLGQVDPTYNSMLEQLAAFEQEKIRLRGDVRALWVKMQAASTADNVTAQRKVDALLAGGSSADVETDAKRHAAMLSRIDDLDLIIPELKRRISNACSAASAIIRTLIADEHKRLARANYAALVEAHRCHSEYVAFADYLNEHDIQWSALNPQFALLLGQPGSSGKVADYAQELLKGGFISKAEIPVELR